MKPHARVARCVLAVLILTLGFAFGAAAGMSPALAAPHGASPPAPALEVDAASAATPICPGLDMADQSSRCTDVVIHGNTFHDVNGNGVYDPHHGPERRLPGLEVQLLDASSGALIGSAITNADGYYRFASLPIGPIYRVQVVVPPGYTPTTPTYKDLESRDFSKYWCCSARVEFGFEPGSPPAVYPSPNPPGVLPPGTPVPPPCCEKPYGRQIHLPILNYEGNNNVCDSIVEVQNIGAWPSKAMLVLWGAPGACPPQCTGPLKVECSGLLRPGSAWNFLDSQLPKAAKSGMVFSAPAIQGGGIAGGGTDVFADLLCEALFHNVVGDCDEFRRFKNAFNEGGIWRVGSYTLDFGAYPGAALAVEVVRKCPGDVDPMVSVTSGYTGLADEMLGAYDPLYGGYAFFVPLIYSDKDGLGSWLYVQNGGTECSSIEIWFKEEDDCLRPRVCDVLALAPGETHQFDASSCVPPGWVGSAWVRGSQPLTVAVDIIGRDLLMTYHGHPSELKYSFDGVPEFTVGSQVAFGPLLYSEYQGWDSLVQVQNLSQVTNAKVKVYFLDRGGNVINTLVDWLCPGGSQGFYLPVVASMPGNWIGSVRIESQDWLAAGQPNVQAPNVTGVAELIKYADIARAQPLEGVAYDLIPEQSAFDWQIGSGWGGLYSGVGRIGIPSFFKDVGGTGLTTEVAIANVVPKPGFTDFVIYIYDQNGLVQNICEKLNEKQVEYLDVAGSLGILPSGFKGSAVVSAVFWEHDVFDAQGYFARNLVGLAAVKIERSGTTFGVDVPGDESAASQGFPMIGPFAFSGPPHSCPGVPTAPPSSGPAPYPTQPPGPYPTSPPAPWPTTTPGPWPTATGLPTNVPPTGVPTALPPPITSTPGGMPTTPSPPPPP
ncbi:MAG: SdrD B-like domain-containing protein [Anaerolineae bacterium]